MVAGGFDFGLGDAVSQVALYDVAEGVWIVGPDLPFPNWLARTVQYGPTFRVFGGAGSDYAATDAILEFDPDNMVVLDETLGNAVGSFFLIDVNEDDFCGPI